MANDNLGACDCPICGADAHIRESKKFKAYIVCGECGFQGFARGVIANAKLRLRIRQPAALPVELPADLPVIQVKPAATVPAAAKAAPVIRRHTAEGENQPGSEKDAPPARELTIFDGAFWKGTKQ